MHFGMKMHYFQVFNSKPPKKLRPPLRAVGYQRLIHFNTKTQTTLKLTFTAKQKMHFGMKMHYLHFFKAKPPQK